MSDEDTGGDWNGAVPIPDAPDLSTEVRITEKRPVYHGNYSLIYKGSYCGEEVAYYIPFDHSSADPLCRLLSRF
jgi:hypothetical protein